MGVAPSPVGYGAQATIATNSLAGLQFTDGAGSTIISGTVDPTSVATNGLKGSLYLNTSNSNVYVKQDNGSTTSWTAMTPSIGVAASYNLTTAVSYTANAAIVCPTSVLDTNSAYNTSTGEFTVPAGQGGNYYIGITWALTAASNTYIKISGGAIGYLDTNQASSSSSGGKIFPLNAGDVVTWHSDASGTTLASGSNGALINAYIFKTGPIATSGGGGSGITRSIVSVTSTVTGSAAALTDYVYLLGVSAVFTMPTAVSNTNRYTLKNIDTTNKTVAFTASETCDGSTTVLLTPNTSVDIISDNTNWRII